MKSRALGKNVKMLDGSKVYCENCHTTWFIPLPKAFLDWCNEAKQFYHQHRDCAGRPNRVDLIKKGSAVKCKFCHVEKDLEITGDIEEWSRADIEFALEHKECK